MLRSRNMRIRIWRSIIFIIAVIAAIIVNKWLESGEQRQRDEALELQISWLETREERQAGREIQTVASSDIQVDVINREYADLSVIFY